MRESVHTYMHACTHLNQTLICSPVSCTYERTDIGAGAHHHCLYPGVTYEKGRLGREEEKVFRGSVGAQPCQYNSSFIICLLYVLYMLS